MDQSIHNTGRRSFSIPEFAKRHGMSTATVWRRIAAGEIAAFKTGHLTRILLEEEGRWLNACSTIVPISPETPE